MENRHRTGNEVKESLKKGYRNDREREEYERK